MDVLRPASRHELSLLRFPDRRTNWVIVLRVHLLGEVPDLTPRLAELVDAVPLVGARLSGETWRCGAAPVPLRVTGDPLDDPRLIESFDLAREAPLRILVGDHGVVAIAAHHAAFDGLGITAVFDHLLGGPLPQPVASPPPGEPDGLGPYLNRLVHPADRVPPSPDTPAGDFLAARVIEVRGREVTARLAASCVAACSRWAREQGAPLHKIGITIAVGGPAGVGNVAGFRRVDLDASEPVRPAVVAAMATPEEPAGQVRSPRAMKLLQPIVNRFSDTLLVTNLGRHRLPGVRQLDVWAVARGRSAVAFGSAAVEGGVTSLSIRVRDIAPADALRLLDDAAERMESTR